MRVILCICPELFVVVRITSFVGGLSTLLREMVTEWLCPESNDEVIGSKNLSSSMLGDVVLESPYPSHPISVIMRGSEKSAPAFRINERLSMIRSF